MLFTAASPIALAQNPAPLKGFVDLHTHPLSNVGFGGKLVYGGVDIGAFLPADPDCKEKVYARDEGQALGHDKSTHGGVNYLNPGDNPCGDTIREGVIHAVQEANKANNPHGDAFGYPIFGEWPVWHDITHQKMWVEWIRRAYQGGLRVMVALAVNNKTLADMTRGFNDLPGDDVSSADFQIGEIKSFVGRHSEWMEIASNSADLYRIVSANKLAVVIGIEIDHIGNFHDRVPPSDDTVKAEIDRLYKEGVRYIFPIHLLDNAFGGAAAFESIFNASNFREDGHPWALVCADPTDVKDNDINDQAAGGFTYDNDGLGLLNTVVQLGKTGFAVMSLPTLQCRLGLGQKNSLGLTASGVVGIKQMMRHAMLIDIDHMSQAAEDQTLTLATQFGYPVNSGHSAVRGAAPTNHNERALRADQYFTIGQLHGMAGVGSAGADAPQWLTLYNQVIQAMGGDTTYKSYAGNIVAGFGTDTGGLALGMRPRRGSRLQYNTAFPPSADGARIWDYQLDGVAHYGMLWDFLEDIKTLPGGADMVENNFMFGADYFFHTWQIAETCSKEIDKVMPLPPPEGPIVTAVTPDSTPLGTTPTVTITGRNFIGVRSVVPADTFTVNSPTQITAHIPKNLSPGAHDIVVKTCVNLPSSTPGTVEFRVTVPVITSISPWTGPITGGTSVEISGSGFRKYDASSPYGTLTPLSFGGVPIDAQCSPTVCKVVSPPAAKPGPVDIIATVSVPSAASPADVFRYTEHPALTKFELPDLSSWIGSGAVSSLSGRVYLNGNAPVGGAVVTLASSDPGVVRMDPTVNIQAGRQVGDVALTLVPPILGRVTLTAEYLGSSAASTFDVVWPPITIGVDNTDLQTDESTIATVTLNARAATGGAAVSLSASDASAVSVPPSVTVPAGSYRSSFSISNTYSGPAKLVTISATYQGASASCSLTVQCPSKPRKPCPKGFMWVDCQCVKGGKPQ